MINDDRIAQNAPTTDDVNQQISRVRKELDHFKDVVANAVSRLNARIQALEQRLPALRTRIRR